MSLSEEQAASLSAETVVVAAGRPPRERDAPVNPPIVLSSTYFGTGPLGRLDREPLVELDHDIGPAVEAGTDQLGTFVDSEQP